MAIVSRIRVGDRVTVRFGTRAVPATVIEDRGDYGSPPVQIVRVSWTPADVEEAEEFEVSTQDLELAVA